MATSTEQKPHAGHDLIDSTTDPAGESAEVSELLDKLDLGTRRSVSGSPDDGNDSAVKSLFGLLFSPIVLILLAWAAIFWRYGREILSSMAPFAR